MPRQKLSEVKSGKVRAEKGQLDLAKWKPLVTLMSVVSGVMRGKPECVRLKKCLKVKEEKAANSGGYLMKLTGDRMEKGLRGGCRMQGCEMGEN